VNRYPYQGRGNTNLEAQYINPLTKALFDASDVITGHFSGSYLAFYTGIFSGELPGSATLNAVSDFNAKSGANILLDALLTAEVKSAIVKITGSTRIELNGNTKQFVTWTELNTALQAMVSAANLLYLTAADNGVKDGGLTLDISASKTTTVVTGG
jgi:hypothetical protein